MTVTPEKLWQTASRRIKLLGAELPIAEQSLETLLDALPGRLPAESYFSWLTRGLKMAKLIPFSKMQLSTLLKFSVWAADTRESETALPEIPLISVNQQFRLKIEQMAHNKLRLTIEALGLASSRYAGSLIGIAGADSKDQLVSLIRLDADGEGEDATLEDSLAVRQALLRPVIALIEQSDA